MKKKSEINFQLLLIIICINFSQLLNAQIVREIDSINTCLNKAQTDSERVIFLIERSKKQFNLNIEDADSSAAKALTIAERIKSPDAIAQIHLIKSQILSEKTNYAVAVDEIYLAIQIFNKHNKKKGLGLAYFQLGTIYKKLGDFPKAISEFLISNQLFIFLNDLDKIANCHTQLGHIFIDMLNQQNAKTFFPKALLYYDSTLTDLLEGKLTNRLSIAYINLANAYLIYQKYWPSDAGLNKSLIYSQQSLNYAENAHNLIHIGICYMNISNVYTFKKQYDKAIYYANRANDSILKSGNQFYKFDIQHNIIKIFIEKNDYQTAKKELQKYYELIAKNHSNLEYSYYYKMLSDINFAQNNIAEGLKNRTLYEQYKDSIFNENKATELTKTEVTFKTKQKDIEITNLNQEKILNIQKITQQKTVKQILFLSIGLILTLLVLLLNRYRNKLKTNLIIEAQNKELEKLSIVAKEAINSVLITDTYLNIEWMNAAFLKSFGYESVTDLINHKGRSALNICPKDFDLTTLESEFLVHHSLTFESAYERKSGENFWLKVSVTPILNKSNFITSLIFVGTDITELKFAKEAAESALHLQELFLANTSHELRTPINGILGMTKQMLETNLNDHQNAYLNAIQESSYNLLYVVNDVLDLSKIKAGKIEYKQKEFKIRTLLNNLYLSQKIKANEKNIILNFEVKNNIPDVLIGDATRLIQILYNLCSNALKFTQKGKVEVIVSLIEISNTTALINFEITDTGIGISEDKLNFIFESFAQAEKSTSSKFGGTGLGLSISKALVEQQGGKINIQSKLNMGSTFTFSLPFKIGNQNWETEKNNSSPQFISTTALEHLHILLVEDNLINQKVAEYELNKLNIKTTTADTAEKAITLLANHHYDLILMDIRLPDMDGIEATKWIRNNSTSPKNKIPIIALTANAFSKEKESCLAAEMNDYISKPFNSLELYNKIFKWTQQNS